MKKVISLIMATALCAGAFVLGTTAKAQAALPCTYDTISQASAQVVAAANAYNAAKAEEAAYKAAFEAVKNQGPQSLQYIAAANAYENAINRTKWVYDQLTNAEAFLKNIKGREAVEDDYINAVNALPLQGNAQVTAQSAQAAQEVANMTLGQIQTVKNVIAGYQQQLAVSPSLQTQINELNAQLAVLQADYANKQAIADQKKAEAASAATAWANSGYDKKYIDYWYNRERYAANPQCDCFDFYTGTCHCAKEDCKVNGCYCGEE